MCHRLAVILPTYFVVYALAYLAAYLLRFDLRLPAIHGEVFLVGLPFVLLVKFAVCLVAGEWRRTFRHTTIVDVAWLVGGALVAGAACQGVLQWVLVGLPFPRSVIPLDAILTVLLMALVRMGIRVTANGGWRGLASRDDSRALVYGTDEAAIGIARALQSGSSGFRVVGFVDDCPNTRHSLIAGIPVCRPTHGWRRLARRRRVDYVLVPRSVPGDTVRELVDEFTGTSVRVQAVPTVDELVGAEDRLRVRDVTITDLLRREPARLDFESIRQYVSGYRVLVTGAAGSIGSELCRQLADLEPEQLVLLDHSENGIFDIEQEFARRRIGIEPVVANVADPQALRRVMETHRPQIVFHAAAYKHVPLMELNPHEAIRNNIVGTRLLVDLCDRFAVERLVMISTDKAVEPTSVMGTTKLLSEKYLQAVAADSDTRMIIVRFGNVLDSAGSVVPTFRHQIAAGGPLTVTHPDMQRYFMTIPEAVQLVLQAGAVGDSGDVLVLEMGQPVKILYLAKDMIELSGLKYPDDIDIVMTGMRPGEKLTETLFFETERGAKKVHEQIYRVPSLEPSLPIVQADLDRLVNTLDRPAADLIEQLMTTVARYTHRATENTEELRPAA